MSGADLTRLVALSALWGGSFLFMRLAVPEFGPVALVFVRVAGAALLLLPWLLWRGEAASLRAHWKPIALVGLVNTAVPFTLFAVAALVLSAGLMAVFNSTAPLWAALIGWAWFGQRPTHGQRLGQRRGAGRGLHRAGLRAVLQAYRRRRRDQGGLGDLLIPAFAMLWGALILGERPTLAMGVGCAVILLGTALSTGLLLPGALIQRNAQRKRL